MSEMRGCEFCNTQKEKWKRGGDAVKRTVKWFETLMKANRKAIDKGLEKLRAISAELKDLKGFSFQSRADEGMEFVKELLHLRNQNQILERQIEEAKKRDLKRFSDQKLLVKKGRAI
jgi:hypothetical protein